MRPDASNSSGQLPATSGWPLWQQQLRAILRLELKRNLFSRTSIRLLFLCALPTGLALLAFLAGRTIGNDFNLEMGADPFSKFYTGFILMIVVFIGCSVVFMNLFRGEILARSLHYYLLCPVRRDVLVLGKFLSGLVITLVLFCSTTLLCFVLFQFTTRHAAASSFLFSGEGLRQGFGYLLATTLACVGYGSFFLLLGLVFRNPVIPGLILWLWEGINYLLPPMLKKISIVHYLRSITPVPVSDGPLAIVAEPTPLWLAVAGLVIVAGIAMALATLRVRRMEISYDS